MPRDHPRVCGEQVNVLPLIQTITGSSPRVRGADIAAGKANEATGIIPACAGSRCSFVSRNPGRRDHPRVCGEQIVAGLIRSGVGGSSPRVRGAGGLPDERGYLLGIIPACAGSSSRRAA